MNKIIPAPQQINVELEPRIMKRWTNNCKPEEEGKYWVELAYMKPTVMYLTTINIESQWVGNLKIESWLELEPTPIIPKR